ATGGDRSACRRQATGSRIHGRRGARRLTTRGLLVYGWKATVSASTERAPAVSCKRIRSMTTDEQGRGSWLAINTVSSSLKLAVLDAAGNRLCDEVVEALTDGDAPPGSAHARALDTLLTALPQDLKDSIHATAHRVVH